MVNKTPDRNSWINITKNLVPVKLPVMLNTWHQRPGMDYNFTVF